MSSHKFYKKFDSEYDLYDYLRTEFPKVDEWGCVGNIRGTSGYTRVWPSEFGDGREGFVRAFDYILGDFDLSNPNTFVEIDYHAGGGSYGGYVEPILKKNIPIVYRFKGQKLFDKVMADPDFSPESDLETYKVMFAKNPDLRTREHRRALADKITNGFLNSTDWFYHDHLKNDRQNILAQLITPSDLNKILKSLSEKLNKNLDDLETAERGETYGLITDIEYLTPNDSSSRYAKRLLTNANIALLKDMQDKISASEEKHQQSIDAKRERKELEKQRREEEYKKYKAAEYQKSQELIGNFWSKMPQDEISLKLRADPSSIWDMPKEMRTPERWLVAAAARPDVVTFAPPEIKDYVKKHLNIQKESFNESTTQLMRIVELSKIKK